MQLSIIIVNYNVKFFLEYCLYSVIKACKNIDAEILVIDNNSSDGSQLFFKDKFDTVKFIWSTENIGFARANNLALRMATGRYILFLNPDTIVPEDCLTKCISFFESQSDPGALGIHMIDGSGRFLKESKRSFPAPFISLYKLSGLSNLFPKSKKFAGYHLGYLDENKNNEVDVLAGAFIMTSKKIIDKLGGFDEDFFMYGEDIDLSFRIQKAGYRNFYFAESSIIHFKGESTKKNSIKYVRMFYKAMSIFVNKHYPSSKARVFNFLIQCAILARAFFSFGGKFLRWIGMPVIDAITILCSFIITKILWSNYIRHHIHYSSNLLITTFLSIVLIFVSAFYFSGLYDGGGYKQLKLNRAVIVSFILLLAGYSLLPESLRFSRGILVFGSIITYILITIIRNLLVRFKVLDNWDEDENKQIIIAGTLSEYATVLSLMKNAGMAARVLGRLDVEPESVTDSIGNVFNLKQLYKIYPIKEVILCEGKMTFQQIIQLTKTIPHTIRIKFFTSKAESIIGSDSKNLSGQYLTANSNFRLSTKAAKRNKQLTDIMISIIFSVSFPFHILLQKKSLGFFKNVFNVLVRKKTWVGYASSFNDLPPLKRGIISVTGLPTFMNTLPEENLVSADTWYAKNYTIWHDIQLIFKSYKFLYL